MLAKKLKEAVENTIFKVFERNVSRDLVKHFRLYTFNTQILKQNILVVSSLR
jgi:hypothetical protein